MPLFYIEVNCEVCNQCDGLEYGVYAADMYHSLALDAVLIPFKVERDFFSI